jgi:hypothetical protein
VFSHRLDPEQTSLNINAIKGGVEVPMTLRAFVTSAVLLMASLGCNAENLDSLSAAVRSYSKESATPSYRYAWFDLNKDGQPDAVVMLLGSDFCGSGGCTLVVFRGTRDGFRFVSSSTVSREPIAALSESHHGWRTLLVTARDKGPVVMRFNGSKYPLNPSIQPAATKAQSESAEPLKFEAAPPSGK